MGEKFVVLRIDSITDEVEKFMVVNQLEKPNHQIVFISLDQMKKFAGKMLELKNNANKLFVIMSKTAFDFLNMNQEDIIGKSCKLLLISIDS